MAISRRSFLAAGSALAALGAGAPYRGGGVTGDRVAPTASSSSGFDPWVEVHIPNLKHNVAEIQKLVAPRPILAVIKNNGYGLGVANVGTALEPLVPVAGFAVVKLHEAISLRDAGLRKPVLLMGPLEEKDLELAIARDIQPMVYTPVGPVLDRLAAERQRPIPLHICVDTGIGRVGVPWREAAPFIRDLAGRKSVALQGTMMTFTEDADFDREQLSRFTTLASGLEAEGLRVGRKHAVSSFGLFQHPDAFLDMVRPGMALFGVYPEAPFRSAGILDLRPAVALKARVAYVKKLQKGDSAGYNQAYVASGDTWVATLPAGHADGLPRAAAKGASVRIRGRLFPLIAAVSASHSIAELGPSTDVRIGDEVVFFDWQEGSRPEDVAAACNASVYDLTMHLNALLPRRLV
jgi:alanine racemase